VANLVLNLSKAGDRAPQKLSLNLTKAERFKVRLAWEGQTDLDLHAIVCANHGDGAKASSLEDILSAYNLRRRIGGSEVGVLDKRADGSFAVHDGALVHSPDAIDGDQLEVDEWIEVDPARLAPAPGAAIEIPLLAMIHQKTVARRFRDVSNAWVSIENASGKELMNARLSMQFGEFVGVQMGSIMIDDEGTHFAPVGVGFNGDFNSVLEHFS
jgi:tellurium resistance protein TerD